MKLATYNILANAYIRPAWYPRTDAGIFVVAQRRNALLQRIIGFGAAVVCLQEVEPDACSFLQAALAEHGYNGSYAQKHELRPDGCATFVRSSALSLRASDVLYYHDTAVGSADSGHLALIVECEYQDRRLGIVNTHLRWDKPNMRGQQHIGYRQIMELLDVYLPARQRVDGWLICGDFNVEPESDVISALQHHGFVDAGRDTGFYTCNSNAVAKRIDYIFHSRQLNVQLLPQRTIDDLTPLPSADEPSDHLPIIGNVRWDSLTAATA